MSTDGPAGINLELSVAQPRLTPTQVSAASGHLLRYRIMAFVTGVVLLAGTVELIVKYAGDVDPPGYAYLWIAHGWLFVIYLIVTAILGYTLRWPIPRYLLVMLAGTIPTMSFVAEHFVTRAVRESGQPVAVRD